MTATISRFGLERIPSIRPWLLEGGIVLWALLTTPLAIFMALESGRTWVLLALLGGPLAFVLRRTPMAAAAALVAGSMVIRLAWVGLAGSDPIVVSQMAAERAFSGLDPYAVTYLGGSYPYGPLGLLTYQAGIPGEVIGTVLTSALLAYGRAWMTLAFFNAWPQFIYTAVIGDNDYSVGFVLLLAIVVMRHRPTLGVVLLAASVAIKPYGAAWLLPAFGYVGLSAAAVGVVALAVLWAPVLLLWGIPSYLHAVEVSEASRPIQARLFPSWTFADIPILRLLIVPFSVAGLFLRSWRAMALLGSAGFLAFIGFSPWSHASILAAVVPVIGLALEGQDWRRPTTSSAPAEVQPG